CFPYLCCLGRESHNRWLGTAHTVQPTFIPESRHLIHFHRQPYCLGHMKTHIATIVCFLIALAAITGCRPALTRDNAKSLIPDGMGEAQVYQLLGTNGVTTYNQHGKKSVMYWFEFIGPPPGIKTKVDNITVTFSNGVIIGRYFSTP
ncbi:MAG TPA: hypothetical protein VK742_18890, partial [Candidatus Sulfotelmatobacter sp.]|nr:hypothetical protein [Candidatus Sulfotelmatobacter sp.]